MKINKMIKPATPWNVTLAKLTKLEHIVTEKEQTALEARWLFGRELVTRRVNYKGRLVIPHDLITMTITQCKVSKRELNFRVRFALRFPTKKEMCNAITHYPSWWRMTQEGLVERKKKKPPTSKSQPAHAGPWVIRRLAKELDHAYAHHATLSRDQVKDLEQLVAKLQTILDQIDRNDEARAS